MMSFDKITPSEMACVERIADRAVKWYRLAGDGFGAKLAAMMDVSACHANGCPLKLNELEAADDANFVHDVMGIRRHIDRSTGKLQNCFLPRFAA